MINLLKTDQQIIAEIHNEFDTAQDRLLDQSEKLLCELNIPTESSIEKQAERLKSIGFVNTPTVGKAESLKKHREANIQMVVKTKEQAETIRYYKQAYPFLKFITEDELNRICDKYNLIHAPVKNYTKDVPEKNLRDIERAQALKANDAILATYRFFERSLRYYKEYYEEFLKAIGKSEPIFTQLELNTLMNQAFPHKTNWVDVEGGNFSTTAWFVISKYLRDNGHPMVKEASYWDGYETIDKSGLFIAAPASHFNLNDLKKKSKYGFFNVTTREVKDPIVFRYVRGGIQILTMWGLEAEDQALVNPINN